MVKLLADGLPTRRSNVRMSGAVLKAFYARADRVIARVHQDGIDECVTARGGRLISIGGIYNALKASPFNADRFILFDFEDNYANFLINYDEVHGSTLVEPQLSEPLLVDRDTGLLLDGTHRLVRNYRNGIFRLFAYVLPFSTDAFMLPPDYAAL